MYLEKREEEIFEGEEEYRKQLERYNKLKEMFRKHFYEIFKWAIFKTIGIILLDVCLWVLIPEKLISIFGILVFTTVFIESQIETKNHLEIEASSYHRYNHLYQNLEKEYQKKYKFQKEMEKKEESVLDKGNMIQKEKIENIRQRQEELYLLKDELINIAMSPNSPKSKGK